MIQCVFKRRRLLNGEMSEWLKEPVLKTGGAQVPVGSNPTLSANFSKVNPDLRKYPSGRRGSPAKGVGWIKPARGFKSLLPRHEKSWNRNGSRTFSFWLPQLFPQSAGSTQNLLDILLGLVCGLLPTFLSDMRVNIHGSGDGRVPQSLLQGLVAFVVFQGGSSIKMPQIMKTSVVKSDTANNLFEMLIDGYMGEMPSRFVRKDKIVRIFPVRSNQQLHLNLQTFLLLKDCHNRGSDCDCTGLRGFRRNKLVKCTRILIALLELLVDIDGILLKVYAAPRQP